MLERNARCLSGQPSTRLSARPEGQLVIVSVYSRQLLCLFPQHGPGPKHRRPIRLEPWQQKIVANEPEAFLRGLIHSDGCRFINRVHINGTTYAYPRDNFTSARLDEFVGPKY